MPTYWLPWPGNKKANPPLGWPFPIKTVRLPEAFFPESLPIASWHIATAVISSARSTTMTRRTGFWGSKTLRLSLQRFPMLWVEVSCTTSLDHLSILSMSVCSFGPEKAAISTVPSHEGSNFAVVCSSSTAWKLLPPNPNALTPALRCFPFSQSQGRSWVFR